MTATIAPEETREDDTITLTLDQFGRVNRKELLGAFADGKYVTPVYGRDRATVAEDITSALRGIAPTEEDLILNAFGYGNPRRIAAYRNGRAYLVSAYYGYASGHELPEV